MVCVVSLFSGAGGLDLGFENEDFNIIWANEFDRKIWDTYKYNHPTTFLDKRSICDIHASEIPDCDGIIGGPPCQSWSLAGCLRGLDDPRGKLFYDYLRILKEKQPKFFVAENVAGMMSVRNLDAFNHIKSEFKKCGYNVTYKLLNTSNYGIPQDRKRVIIIGYRKDLNIVFDFKNMKKSDKIKTLNDTISDLPEPLPALEKNRTNNDTGDVLNNEYFIGDFSSIFMSRNRIRNWDQPSFTIQASGRQAPIFPGSDPMVKIEKDKWEFSGDNYRRLSVRECARIQTFPDDFKFIYDNVNDGYKMIGNAVPVKFAQLIAQQIMCDLKST